MTATRTILGAVCAALLSACGAPTYQLQSGQLAARLRLTGAERLATCVAGELRNLVPDARGYVDIPAGRPIYITAYFTSTLGHCYPTIAFTPLPGRSYQINNQARAERCQLTVMIEDSAANYGVRLEDTAHAPARNCQATDS